MWHWESFNVTEGFPKMEERERRRDGLNIQAFLRLSRLDTFVCDIVAAVDVYSDLVLLDLDVDHSLARSI